MSNRVTWVRLVGASALIFGILLGGSGCSMVSSGKPDGSVPAQPVVLQQAKDETFAWQDEIVGLVPADVRRGELVRTQFATLQDRCSGENVWRWPGAAGLDIDPSFDTEQFLHDLDTYWSEKPGWATDRRDVNAPELQMTRNDGAWVAVAVLHQGSELSIQSNSACFQLPGPEDPSEKY